MTLTRHVIRSVLAAWLVVALCLVFLPVAAQQTPTPAAQPYQGSGQALPFSKSSDVVSAIDRYWSGVFSTAGLSYSSPGLVVADQPTSTPCIPIDSSSIAFYCNL